MSTAQLRRAAGALVLIGLAAPSAAQTQRVVPPQALAWIDIATFQGFGMPGMPMGAGGGAPNPMAAIGGALFGGGARNENRFGNTIALPPGRWLDVTLMSRGQPSLAAGQMAVPPGSGLAPTLELVSPKGTPTPPPDPGDERVVQHEPPKPRGKVSLYWGCGETVRPGQPRTVDFAAAVPADMAQIFNGRRATQQGAHSTPGRPIWPSEKDARMIPVTGSFAGPIAFTAQGVPESFRFNLPAQQDIMPAIDLKQAPAGGATRLAWTALPTARGYFIAVMGSKGREEMVMWTSSELPDTGFGLVEYQTNPAVDGWLRDKVLLAPSTTTCAVPAGVFGESGGAMLRMIAYGTELNLVHPPRPTDPKIAWEQQWAVKVRVKSVTSAMLGMEMPAQPPAASAPAEPPAGAPTPSAGAPEAPPAESNPAGRALDVLRGILRR